MITSGKFHRNLFSIQYSGKVKAIYVARDGRLDRQKPQQRRLQRHSNDTDNNWKPQPSSFLVGRQFSQQSAIMLDCDDSIVGYKHYSDRPRQRTSLKVTQLGRTASKWIAINLDFCWWKSADTNATSNSLNKLWSLKIYLRGDTYNASPKLTGAKGPLTGAKRPVTMCK